MPWPTWASKMEAAMRRPDSRVDTVGGVGQGVAAGVMIMCVCSPQDRRAAAAARIAAGRRSAVKGRAGGAAAVVLRVDLDAVAGVEAFVGGWRVRWRNVTGGRSSKTLLGMYSTQERVKLLLNRAAWDTDAAMSVRRRFVVDGLTQRVGNAGGGAGGLGVGTCSVRRSGPA